MRTVIAGTASAMAALIAVGVVGGASAETPASVPGSASPAVRTVSVDGVATVPLTQGPSAAGARTAYRQAMAAAEADGHEKAEFLVGKAGAGLGAVQNIAEGGGGISCTDGEGGYVEYQGEQPDFGESSVSRPPLYAAAKGAPSAAHPVVHPKRRHKKAPATRATAASPAATSSATASCTLSAQVALVYALS